MKTIICAAIAALVATSSAFAMGQEPKKTFEEAIVANVFDNFKSNTANFDVNDVDDVIAGFKVKLDTPAPLTSCLPGNVKKTGQKLTVNMGCYIRGYDTAMQASASITYHMGAGTITEIEGGCSTFEVLKAKPGNIKFERTCNIQGKTVTIVSELKVRK